MRYVALLRAINVGGHTVKMDRLRALFEELGFRNVETFIASGNVLFDAPARPVAGIERKIEAHLLEALGYEVETFVRPLSALAGVLASHPFVTATEDGHQLYIGFVHGPISDENSKRLAAINTTIDFFHTGECEIYWLCHRNMSETLVTMKSLEKAIGMPATFRNVNTVRRLSARATPP